jgi:hypothetical protein
MNTALLSRKYEFEVNVQAFIAATLAFVAVVFVCCSALTTRTPLGYFDASSLLWLFLLVPGFLYIILNQALRLPRLKRDMRQSAKLVSGSLAAPLAEIQQQVQTPKFPLDIHLRQAWKWRISFFIALLVWGALFGLLSNWLQSAIGFPATTLVISAVSTCWLFLTLLYPPYPETQRIVATEEGMKINNISTIAWSDTSVFAIIGPRRRNSSVIFYELADTEESLVFRVRTKPFPWYSWLAPDMSFAEYQAQMQQLLGFIAAKTALPLLDLRY